MGNFFSREKKYLILDWDLCLHMISTPSNKSVKDVYNSLLEKYGVGYDKEKVYMDNLCHFFNTIIERKRYGNLEFAIVTRNSYENVDWFLKYRMGITFPIDIISQEKIKDRDNIEKPIVNDKLSLFVTYFNLNNKKVDICIVDDGEEEHISANKAAQEYENISLSHVYVNRPPRGNLYDESWGLMNQPKAVDDLKSFLKKENNNYELNIIIIIFFFMFFCFNQFY